MMATEASSPTTQRRLFRRRLAAEDRGHFVSQATMTPLAPSRSSGILRRPQQRHVPTPSALPLAPALLAAAAAAAAAADADSEDPLMARPKLRRCKSEECVHTWDLCLLYPSLFAWDGAVTEATAAEATAVEDEDESPGTSAHHARKTPPLNPSPKVAAPEVAAVAAAAAAAPTTPGLASPTRKAPPPPPKTQAPAAPQGEASREHAPIEVILKHMFLGFGSGEQLREYMDAVLLTHHYMLRTSDLVARICATYARPLSVFSWLSMEDARAETLGEEVRVRCLRCLLMWSRLHAEFPRDPDAIRVAASFLAGTVLLRHEAYATEIARRLSRPLVFELTSKLSLQEQLTPTFVRLRALVQQEAAQTDDWTTSFDDPAIRARLGAPGAGGKRKSLRMLVRKGHRASIASSLGNVGLSLASPTKPESSPSASSSSSSASGVDVPRLKIPTTLRSNEMPAAPLTVPARAHSEATQPPHFSTPPSTPPSAASPASSPDPSPPSSSRMLGSSTPATPTPSSNSGMLLPSASQSPHPQLFGGAVADHALLQRTNSAIDFSAPQHATAEAAATPSAEARPEPSFWEFLGVQPLSSAPLSPHTHDQIQKLVQKVITADRGECEVGTQHLALFLVSSQLCRTRTRNFKQLPRCFKEAEGVEAAARELRIARQVVVELCNSLSKSKALRSFPEKNAMFSSSNPSETTLFFFNEESSQKIVQPDAFPDSLIPKDFAPVSLAFTDIHPVELARQLTLVEQEYFRAVTIAELSNKAWLSKDPLERTTFAPNVLTIMDQSNCVSTWVASEIVLTPNLRQRVAVFSRFVELAEHLRRLRNFNGMMEVMVGLQHPSVRRLTATQEALSSGSQKLFRQLLAIASPEKNYSNYRELLTSEANRPQLPYLALWLRDLVFLEDGNALYTTMPGRSVPLYNVYKLRLLRRIFRQFLDSKQLLYRLKYVHPISEFVRNIKCVSDPKALFKHSLDCEPADHRAASRLRDILALI